MSDVRQHLKQRVVVHETREYLILALYPFVVFALLIFHKSMILAEHHIDYTLHGLALINALVLAKVMLAPEDLGFGDWFVIQLS